MYEQYSSSASTLLPPSVHAWLQTLINFPGWIRAVVNEAANSESRGHVLPFSAFVWFQCPKVTRFPHEFVLFDYDDDDDLKHNYSHSYLCWPCWDQVYYLSLILHFPLIYLCWAQRLFSQKQIEGEKLQGFRGPLSTDSLNRFLACIWRHTQYAYRFWLEKIPIHR